MCRWTGCCDARRVPQVKRPEHEVEMVTSHIPKRAISVRPIAAPARWVEHRVIRRRRARAKPLIPVHVLWSAFGVRLEVTPGPCFSNTCVDFKNISNRTTTD